MFPIKIARRAKTIVAKVTRASSVLTKRSTSFSALASNKQSARNIVLKAYYTNPPLPYNHFEFQTCVELQQKACALFGDKPVLGTKVGNVYEWMSYKQLGDGVQKFRNVLAERHFKFDDKLAIISNNRTEWVVAMYATMSLGGQLVPM